MARPRDRRHQGRRKARPAPRPRQTKTEVTAKVRKLEKLRDEGRVPKAGQRYRVPPVADVIGSDNIACPAERLGERVFRL